MRPVHNLHYLLCTHWRHSPVIIYCQSKMPNFSISNSGDIFANSTALRDFTCSGSSSQPPQLFDPSHTCLSLQNEFYLAYCKSKQKIYPSLLKSTLTWVEDTFCHPQSSQIEWSRCKRRQGLLGKPIESDPMSRKVRRQMCCPSAFYP